MGVFANNAITDNGRILLADVMAGAVFTPTRIVIGSGSLPSGATPQSMTDVITAVKSLDINKKKRTPDGKIILGGVYTNEDITEAFYFRELALYAKAVYLNADGSVKSESAEVLYSYGNAGATADLMPAYSTSTVVEKQIDLVTWVGNTAAVNLTIDSGLFISTSEKGQPYGVAELDESGIVPIGQIPDVFVKKTGDTMTGRLWTGNGVSNGFGSIASNSYSLHLGAFREANNAESAYTNLIINNDPNVTDRERLRLSVDTMDGSDHSLISYLIYGTHNKPTPEEINAARAIQSHITVEVGADKPYKTVQSAIDALPRNTGGWQATIVIDAGTYNESFALANFIGGTIKIVAADIYNAPTIAGNIYIINCTATIILESLNIAPSAGNYGVAVDYSPKVLLQSLNILGAEKGTQNGITVSMNSNCVVNRCFIKKFGNAIFPTYGGKVAVYECSIEETTVGIYASCGIAQVSSTAMSVDTEYATDHGGRIFVGSQVEGNSPAVVATAELTDTANIKLDLAAEPFSNQVATFTAPCSCADVSEGLVINGEIYTVCDAMGACVTGTGGAWCEGATVSVALDVENKRAFLQNKASAAPADMVTVTESRSLILTDSGRLLCVESENEVVLTIPAESDAAFTVGTELEVCQLGVGAVSLAAAEGVTLLSAGGAVMVAEQYGCVTLKKLGADKWLLGGLLG